MAAIRPLSRVSAPAVAPAATTRRNLGRVRLRPILALFAASVIAVLGYGYWHQYTHATLGIALRDGSVHNRWQPLGAAHLRLVDDRGRERAQAQSRPGGAVVLTGPSEFACDGLEFRGDRSEWRACFARQSRWLATWVRTLRHVDVAIGSCRLRADVTPKLMADDWWLWWVPLPHVGGRPYLHASVSLAIDASDCNVVAPR